MTVNAMTVNAMTITLDSACELHPQVTLRPESFGALAYHYGNRKLTFLKHPDIVAVVRDMAKHATLADALTASGVHQDRWPSFVTAINALQSSEVVRVR